MYIAYAIVFVVMHTVCFGVTAKNTSLVYLTLLLFYVTRILFVFFIFRVVGVYIVMS